MGRDMISQVPTVDKLEAGHFITILQQTCDEQLAKVIYKTIESDYLTYLTLKPDDRERLYVLKILEDFFNLIGRNSSFGSEISSIWVEHIQSSTLFDDPGVGELSGSGINRMLREFANKNISFKFPLDTKEDGFICIGSYLIISARRDIYISSYKRDNQDPILVANIGKNYNLYLDRPTNTYISLYDLDLLLQGVEIVMRYDLVAGKDVVDRMVATNDSRLEELIDLVPTLNNNIKPSVIELNYKYDAIDALADELDDESILSF